MPRPKFFILILMLLFAGCINNSDNPAPDLSAGNYKGSFYNTLPTHHIYGDVSLRLSDTKHFSMILTLTASNNGVYNDTSGFITGTWKQKQYSLCTDTHDGTGFECDSIRKINNSSFELYIDDPESLGVFWITLIKD